MKCGRICAEVGPTVPLGILICMWGRSLTGMGPSVPRGRTRKEVGPDVPRGKKL